MASSDPPLRTVLRAASAGAWAALVFGSCLTILTTPLYTRAMGDRLGVARLARLTPTDARRAAEEARRFVTDPEAPLPSRVVDGRPGFDESATSHLRDVRGVILAARAVTTVAALALAALAATLFARGDRRELASGMRAGAALTAGVVALLALVAAADFERFFSAFHSLFFEHGTWTFPPDALLIRLFPETFWLASGIAWAVLALAGAALLSIAAGAIGGGTVRRAG